MLRRIKDHRSNQDNQKPSKDKYRMFENLFSKLENNVVVLWLLAKNTLAVVAIAIFTLSPAIVWPLLMGWPVPYCYIAFSIWIAYFATVIVLASLVGYLRETKGI